MHGLIPVLNFGGGILRKISLPLFLVFGSAFCVVDAAPTAVNVYTRGYYLDSFGEWQYCTDSNYHDDDSKLTPKNISWTSSGLALNSDFPSVTFTFSYSGQYAKKWALVKHNADLSDDPVKLLAPTAYNSLKLEYSTIKEYPSASSGFDVIPLANEVQYSLAYAAGTGGTFPSGKQPATATYWYSKTVTAAASGLCTRTGYYQSGWNTAADGTGVAVSCGASVSGSKFSAVNDQAVVLYAQWRPNQYTLQLIVGSGIERIYYKKDGASSWSSVTTTTNVSVDYGATMSVYAVPKAGWTLTGSDGTQLNPKKIVMGMDGATFEPKATAGDISVSFNGNGATSGQTSSKTFKVGAADYLPANGFNRAYTVSFDAQGGNPVSSLTATYSFSRWDSNASGTGSYSYSNQQLVTNPCGSTGAAVLLYAQWSSGAISLPSAVREGHAFAGWYRDSGLTSKVGDAGQSYVPTKSETLYAKWDVRNFTVTFVDGHETAGGAVIDEVSAGYGQKAEPPTPPEHQYSRFTGWDSDDYLCVTGDRTITAQYEYRSYRLDYRSNYRNGTTEKSYLSGKCGPDESTDTVVLLSAKSTAFTKPGYGFLGWDWNDAVKTPKWLAGDVMTYAVIDEHSDFRIYAIWKPNAYTVSFDGNGATSGSTPNQGFQYDEAKALNANGFVRDGQEFLGWKDEQDRVYADGQVVSNLTTVADGIVALKAVWSSHHYVRFDRNGATNETEMALQTFSGSETNALSANIYGKVGYTFAGWATNQVDAAELRVAYTNCEEVAFPLAQPDETNLLYAVWATNRYTIVFDPGEDTAGCRVYGTMDPLTNCAYDTSVAVPCGYTNFCSAGLRGWTRTPGSPTPDYPVAEPSPATLGAMTTVSNLTSVADGSVKLYAVWDGVGALSEAVGLTNAVLVNSCVKGDSKVCWHPVSNFTEEPGHPECLALEQTDQYKEKADPYTGTWQLSMRVFGSGRVCFYWYWEFYSTATSVFELFVDGIKVENLSKNVFWTEEKTVSVVGDGMHEIVWRFNGTINDGSNADKLCVDDVRWTTLTILKPGAEMPEFATEAAAKAAAESTAVIRPNSDVEAVVSAEDYNAMFEVRAVPSGSGTNPWTLAIALKPSVSNEVQKVVDAAEAELISAITNNPISVTFVMKPGLYYGLAGSALLSELATTVIPADKWVLGTGGTGGQKVMAERPSDTSAFYELRVSVSPPTP